MVTSRGGDGFKGILSQFETKPIRKKKVFYDYLPEIWFKLKALFCLAIFRLLELF